MDNTPAFSHMGNKHMQKHMQCFRPLKVSMSWGIYKLMATVCVFLFVVAAQRGTTKTDSHQRLEALHPCLSSHTAFHLTWEWTLLFWSTVASPGVITSQIVWQHLQYVGLGLSQTSQMSDVCIPPLFTSLMNRSHFLHKAGPLIWVFGYKKTIWAFHGAVWMETGDFTQRSVALHIDKHMALRIITKPPDLGYMWIGLCLGYWEWYSISGRWIGFSWLSE